MSSFFKKLSETAKTTASTLGSKSAELVSAGKLKMEKIQLESKIKDKKTEIGALIYQAYAADEEPIHEVIGELCAEIKSMEEEIASLESQMNVESADPAVAAGNMLTCSNCGNKEKEGTAFCSNCGTKLEVPEVKACANCGQPLAPGAKFCAGCGTPTS